MPAESLMILIAGPYRSGTGDDPVLMERNLRALESVALPLLREAGSTRPGDAVYEEILYPIARRLLSRCDAVLRLPGASKGADDDVALAEKLGLRVFEKLDDVAGCESYARVNESEERCL